MVCSSKLITSSKFWHVGCKTGERAAEIMSSPPTPSLDTSAGKSLRYIKTWLHIFLSQNCLEGPAASRSRALVENNNNNNNITHRQTFKHFVCILTKYIFAISTNKLQIATNKHNEKRYNCLLLSIHLMLLIQSLVLTLAVKSSTLQCIMGFIIQLWLWLEKHTIILISAVYNMCTVSKCSEFV